MRTVLIIDDSGEARRRVREILAASGRYAVAGEADSASQADRLYRELRPALVVMDIVMPGVDGIEGVRRILALDPAARIVMVSARGQEALVMESLVAGAADYVGKPLEDGALLAALDRVAASPA